MSPHAVASTSASRRRRAQPSQPLLVSHLASYISAQMGGLDGGEAEKGEWRHRGGLADGGGKGPTGNLRLRHQSELLVLVTGDGE